MSCSFNTAAAQDPVDHQLQLVSQSAAVEYPADLCFSALVLIIFPPILPWMLRFTPPPLALFDSCLRMKKMHPDICSTCRVGTAFHVL